MPVLKIALPKGHLWDNVVSLLNRAGYGLELKAERAYLVRSNDPDLEIRVHRAQNISPLVEEARYDVGITGLDWVDEHDANVEELMNLEIGKVKIVAAVPMSYDIKAGKTAFKKLGSKVKSEGRERLIVASEYPNLTKGLFRDKLKGVPYKFVHSYGATETFIGVADIIVDCTETGRTLNENGWEVVYTLFESSARLVANRKSVKDRWKRDKIEGLLTLIKGAKEAKNMKLLKMNAPEKMFENIIKVLPAMKSPTISRLHGSKKPGYAIEVAVREDQVVHLIPKLKKGGATDILELDIEKVVR